MLAVVLTFDRLPCAALGCYGNEWIDTPHFDRLAAEGFVFDAHVARSVEGNIRHTETADWHAALAAAGVPMAQIREERAGLNWDRAPWSDVVRVTGCDGVDLPPREWPFAMLMKAGRDWLDRTAGQHERHLLWLHSTGVPTSCAVPPEVESLYIDEFADRGVTWSDLSEEERSRHPIVQAAYVSCMDHILGELLDAVAATPEQPTLIVIAAMFGGHWQSIPRRCDLPKMKEAQWLRSPAIWWTNSSQHPGCSEAAGVLQPRTILPGRSPAIVQPQDLGPTLLEWFEPSRAITGDGKSLWPIFDGTTPRVRDAALIDGSVIWTESDVTVLTEPSIDPATIRRFLWPEDLWQVNDVAAQTPEIVAERIRLLQDTQTT